MTEVVTITDLSEIEARRIVKTINDGVAAVWTLVIQAFKGRAWIALGYSSWDDLCESEFRGARLRLPREERQEIVASLRSEGMSTRAIGSALGTGETSVRRDLTGAPNGAPGPVTGADGKSYPPSQPVKVTETTKTETYVDGITGEVVDPPVAAPARPSMRDINAQTSPELKAEFRADADRGVATLTITDACDEIRAITNPERVAAETPAYIAHAVESVQPAIDILNRFLTSWSNR